MLGAALEVKFDGLVEQLNEQLPEVQRGCGGLKESVRGCSWEGMLASSYKDGLAHTFSVGKGFGFCVRDSFILFFFFYCVRVFLLRFACRLLPSAVPAASVLKHCPVHVLCSERG